VKMNFVAMAALALLALSSCAKEDTNSDGNGSGDADGFGGRGDPSNTPSARDAAPGSLSETSPPSAPADNRTQDEASADH
jgi:hypothetical protein